MRKLMLALTFTISAAAVSVSPKAMALNCPDDAIAVPAATSGAPVCIKRTAWDSTKGMAGCAKDAVPIPDERFEPEESKFLCMDDAEWTKAQQICSTDAKPGEPVDALECVCQDSDSVGACGD